MSDSRKATPLRSYAAEGSCYAARAAAAERIGSGSILLARPPQEHTGADADPPRTPDAEIHGSKCRPPPRSRRRNTREQMQTTPALPTQKYTGACSDRPALRSFPTHTAAARAIACRLSLPGHWVRAQPAYRPLCTAVSFAYCRANAASFSIRRIAAGVSRDPSAARRPSARASRRGSSIA